MRSASHTTTIDGPLEDALRQAGMLAPDAALDDVLLSKLAERVKGDRPAFLASLKSQGLTLGQRQRLANAIGHAVREPATPPRDVLASHHFGAIPVGTSTADAATDAVEPLRQQVERLLACGEAGAAHQLLRERGVKTVGDRQRFISECLQEPAPIADGAVAAAAVRQCFASAAEALAAGQVALITLTNSGYLPFTANCLVTLETVGEAPPLTVYCADGPSLERLRSAGGRVAAEGDGGGDGSGGDGGGGGADRLVALHEEGLQHFLAWKEKGWARLMWLKCEAMRRALATHEFVVFTDGDITYERPGAVAHCVDVLCGRGRDAARAHLPPPELVMQNDGLHDDGSDGWGLCAGFMAARRTPATLGAFTVDESHLTPGWDDQRHLNNIRGTLRVQPLPLELFPNGQYWQRHAERLRRARPGPYLVHWNWLVGSEKRGAMQREQRWYVGAQWDAAAAPGKEVPVAVE